jgi:hypothetical protein
MRRPSWNGQTLKTAQRTGRNYAEMHPSGIYDGAYGLQKVGHKQGTKKDWNVGIIPKV